MKLQKVRNGILESYRMNLLAPSWLEPTSESEMMIIEKREKINEQVPWIERWQR